MISSCTCGEARQHKIARRRTADDKIVLLWDDGSLTSALGAVIRGSANPRTDEQRAEARLAGWLVLGEVSLYDADEITPLIKTARALVRRDPGAQPGDLRAAMRRQREAAQLPSPTWETCAGFRLGTFQRITGLASLAIWHETDRGTYQVMHVSRGEGQYNVLNLVESYQRNSMEADERLRAVRKLIEENGCDCPCEHHPDERGDDCEVCLACRIGDVVGK